MVTLIKEILDINKKIKQENDLGKVYELIIETKNKCNNSPSEPDEEVLKSVVLNFVGAMSKVEDFLMDWETKNKNSSDEVLDDSEKLFTFLLNDDNKFREEHLSFLYLVSVLIIFQKN